MGRTWLQEAGGGCLRPLNADTKARLDEPNRTTRIMPVAQAPFGRDLQVFLEGSWIRGQRVEEPSRVVMPLSLWVTKHGARKGFAELARLEAVKLNPLGAVVDFEAGPRLGVPAENRPEARALAKRAFDRIATEVDLTLFAVKLDTLEQALDGRLPMLAWIDTAHRFGWFMHMYSDNCKGLRTAWQLLRLSVGQNTSDVEESLRLIATILDGNG